LRDGQLTPAVDRVFPLSEAAAAHRLLEERTVQGVIASAPLADDIASVKSWTSIKIGYMVGYKLVN
jgi:hypothetical protein